MDADRGLEPLLPRHHLRPRHEGLRQGSGHRILEESAEEDEQVAVPGPLLQGPELGRQDERASGAYRLNN